ncbi:MAG: hypothetical protein HQ521_17795 [Bacteroidetes bacterium]|nr:hypothetical protein [Bacteroidota bacterium]
MDFLQIKKEFENIKQGSQIRFNLSNIDRDITAELKRFIKFYYKDLLYLWQTTYKEINSKVIMLVGDFEVKYTDTYFKICIYIIDNKEVEYYITVQPKENWLNEIGLDINSMIERLPVKFDTQNSLFIYSKTKLSKALISFGDRKNHFEKEYQLRLQEGNILATHITSDLLEPLDLSDTLFEIEQTLDGGFNIHKSLDFEVNLVNILKIRLSEIYFNSAKSILLKGELNLSFGNRELKTNGDFTLTKENYQARIQLNEGEELPIPIIKDRLTIDHVEIDIQGSIIEPSQYVFGIAGNFAIKGKPVVHHNTHDFTYSSLKTNEFNLKFNPTTSSYIPVFIQAYVDEINLSDAITLLTGKRLILPSFINIVKLYSTYVYYCAPGQKNILLNGVPAKEGIALSSGIEFFGLNAYCDFSFLKNEGASGKVQVEKILIGDVLSIKGYGSGTPPNYNGPQIGPDSIEMSFNTNGSPYLESSFQINLLNTLVAKVPKAVFSKDGLEFECEIKIGPVNADLECVLRDIDFFKLKSEFDIKLIGIHIDLDVLGKIDIDLEIGTALTFILKSGIPAASFRIWLNFNNSKLVSQTISFDFEKIKQLDSVIEALGEKLIKELVTLDPLEWLKAIYEGIIKLGENAIEEAKKIASVLIDVFENTADDAVVLMQNAKFELDKIAFILEKGFKKSFEEIANIFKNVHVAIADISEILNKVFRIEPKDIAILFEGIGYGVSDVADVLVDVFKLKEAEINSILKKAGFPVKAIADVLGTIFGGLGGGCLLADEDMLQLSLKDNWYKLNTLKKYRDDVLLKMPGGEEYFRSYSELSSQIIAIIRHTEKESEYLKKLYHEVGIPVVAYIERGRTADINNLFENKLMSLMHGFLSNNQQLIID